MEGKKKRSFYSLAKYPTYEILMESQIASAGAHQAKFIEKLKKNKNYIKNQSRALKFVFSFLFLFLPLLPLITYFQMRDNMGFYTINTVFFVSSFLFMIFFGMTLMYMLMFGLISTGSYMSGNAFKWLQTLPFSKKSLRKIGLMTLFRNLNIPLIILIAGFPIIMLIATQNIIIFLICVAVSILNVIFSFSIMVIIGEKMSFLFSESKIKSKNANIIRTVTMLGYFIIMFGTSFIFSWGMSAVEGFFAVFSTNDPPFILIFILSLVPFLCAPAFLVSLTTLQYQVHPILILTTLTGVALSIVLTWTIFQIAQRALNSAISTEIKIEKVEKREIQFELKSISPIKAYIRKDITSSTRDIQSFMFIFFPIFYPLIMVLSMIGLFNEFPMTTEVILMAWSIILIIYMFIPIMLIVGFLNIEESGSSTLASLPLVPRDQAKAKILLMFSIQGVSLIVTSIVLTLIVESFIVILLLLITLPIAWTMLLLIFELKIKLFGKMKYKYILEELHKENKILKWILMISSEIGFYIAILITGNFLIFIFGIPIALIILGAIGLLSLGLMIFIFIRMFPKVEQMSTYQTGGFLRNNPIIGAIVLTVLYVVFQWLSVFAESLALLPFLSIITINDYTTLLFIDFFFIFGFLTLLWFLIIPKGMKLPEMNVSFKDYAKKIRLSTTKPLLRNILIGFGSFVIFGIVVLIGGITLGNYVFDPSILFGNPNPFRFGLAGLGWFLFIYMLIPGIWEEIAYRGVVIPMLLKKHQLRTSLIISSVMFGFAHTFNLITYTLIGIDPINALISVSFQVIYATLLGFAFGYMYIKTNSLLPSIILHYLIDSAGQIFFNTFISDIFLTSVFLICFLGLIPAILIILFVKLVVKTDTQVNYL
ncbi:MAG: type II CAAX prenyl endopeptidase Rce1 family protein [Candidatus Hodarchaeota archaeon]